MLDILLLKFPRSYIDPWGGGGGDTSSSLPVIRGPYLVILANLKGRISPGFKSNMVRFGIKNMLGMQDA